MVEYWYPYAGHPDGESHIPWFQVVDGKGFRTEGNPAGPSDEPTFAVLDEQAYPIVSLPGLEPTFQIIGSFVYAPEGAPWFWIQGRRHLPDGPAQRRVDEQN